MLRGAILLAAVLALTAPAAASAAKPAATTGGAASIAESSVTLNGRVDPNGKATTSCGGSTAWCAPRRRWSSA